MSDDTTPRHTVSTLSLAIIAKAEALRALATSIQNCARETLSDGVNDLHEAFEETHDYSSADILELYLRIDGMLSKCHQLIDVFEPKEFEFTTEISKQMDIEVSASIEYKVNAFTQEAADSLNDELYDDCKMERADLCELDSYDVTLPGPWECNDIG